MNAVPFDTLKMAQRLEAAGFATPQAAGFSEALAEALLGADLATKADIAALRTELKSELRAEIGSVRTDLRAEIGSVRTDLRAEIGSLRTEMKGEIGSLRSELKGDISDLASRIELLRRDMTIKLGGMLFVAVGVLMAAMRYLPPHP